MVKFIVAMSVRRKLLEQLMPRRPTTWPRRFRLLKEIRGTAAKIKGVTTVCQCVYPRITLQCCIFHYSLHVRWFVYCTSSNAVET